MEKIEKQFCTLGGEFLTPPHHITKKYKKTKALIFDWDGVFNNGVKYSEGGSLFSEPDSMGVNMLRFDRWLVLNHIPYTFIITGANNLKAIEFAKREHFHGVFLNYKNKREALELITQQFSVAHDEIAFFFDDILDLELAHLCGLSFCIRRAASPTLLEYLRDEKTCDYISGNEGGQHAVREVSELLLGLNATFKSTIERRIAYEGAYSQYLAERKQIETEVENHW